MKDSAVSLNTAFEISLISLLFPASSMIPRSSCQGLTALLCYFIDTYSNSQVTFALSSIAQPGKLREREQDPFWFIHQPQNHLLSVEHRSFIGSVI